VDAIVQPNSRSTVASTRISPEDRHALDPLGNVVRHAGPDAASAASNAQKLVVVEGGQKGRASLQALD